MTEIYGGVETGGTWCVCALGSGPRDISAEETFRTGEPAETIERIVAFFAAEGRPRPRAIGIGAFGPLDLDESSPTWGHVTTTPKPGWAHTAVAPVIRDQPLDLRNAQWFLSETLCYLRHLERAGRVRAEPDGAVERWRAA